MSTAFVFAGGGSLGAVEVGMLIALLEAGIHPDLVVGASAGAINAAFFASRPNVAGALELARIWKGIHRRDVFPLSPVSGFLGLVARRRNYAVDPRSLREILRKHLPCERLEQLPLPGHVIAADILRGEEVVLSRGVLVHAVLASAAIPGVFPPVMLDGRCLADGGLANNTPISAAVALGARRVIVLPSGFACELDSAPRDVLGMALHGVTLLMARQLVLDIARFRDEAEIRIVPPLCPLGTSPVDFSRAGELIEEATSQTRAWLQSGGLERRDAPGGLLPHSHGAGG